MARFRYLGEPPSSYVLEYGKCVEIRVPKKDGTLMVLRPIEPNTEFVVGEDIGYDITDELSLMVMRTDPRYQEITN